MNSNQTKKPVGENAKVKSAISKAEGIQQREQLRQMVLNKFIQDLAKTNKKKQELITQKVDEFFKNQKITETSLKELKSVVYQAVTGKTPSQQGGSQQGQDDNKSTGSQKNVQQDDNQSQKSQKSQKSQQQQDHGYQQNDDAQSQNSSKPPASVYYMEGDEEDEWATLVKFDTELFKKEQDLEKQRQTEFKKKMRNELDRQLQDKARRQGEDRTEEQAYVDLQHLQIQAYDIREQKKHDERQKKIMNEKKQRDKQVHDEYSRKKQEKKREKELDEMLVQRIKEEKSQEENEQLQKRLREKQRLQDMMKENDEYKQITDEEARQEKEGDIRLQQEYIRLQEELEQSRENEKQQREAKIKRIMSAFADSVVKDQKEVIKQEDMKMLNHILEQNEREKQEDIRKAQELKIAKGDMRVYLAKQMEEREVKKQQEEELNKMQADIWAKDRVNYQQHESEKQAYIDMVNKKHQQILVEQMSSKDKKAQKKMNTDELQQNKGKFKEIVDSHAQGSDKIKKIQI